jgi:hypothetical protein
MISSAAWPLGMLAFLADTAWLAVTANAAGSMLCHGLFAQLRAEGWPWRACLRSWPPPAFVSTCPSPSTRSANPSLDPLRHRRRPGRARYETIRRPVMVFDEPSAAHEDLLAMERVTWA